MLYNSFLAKQKLSPSDRGIILQYIMLVKNKSYEASLYTDLCNIMTKLNDLDWVNVITDLVQSQMNSSNSLYPLCTEIMNMSKVTDVTDHSTDNPNPIDCNGNNIKDVMLNSSNVNDIVDHFCANPDPKVPCTLYIPSFRMKYNDWNQFPPVKYGGEMKGYNWITTELYNEITAASPLPTDISCSGHNNRDPLECAKAAENFFL